MIMDVIKGFDFVGGILLTMGSVSLIAAIIYGYCVLKTIEKKQRRLMEKLEAMIEK